MSSTGFYWHERCFWHDQGAIGVFSAPGEFLQPQAASESPESKRRLKNILEVSGLIDELHVVKPPAATLADLKRFHTPRYLDELQAGDKAQGGNGGDSAPYMPGSWAAATQSAGLAIAAVEAVALGEVANAYALCRPPGHHAEADQGRGFCLLGNIPVPLAKLTGSRYSIGTFTTATASRRRSIMTPMSSPFPYIKRPTTRWTRVVSMSRAKGPG